MAAGGSSCALMSDEKKYSGKKLHRGAASQSPYPLSRLAPEMPLVDMAREIETAGRFIDTRVSAQLALISEQIKQLQQQAREVLEAARRDQQLHRAECRFKRLPGKVYHLYARPGGGLYFSLLAPGDWRDGPPHEYRGSYRLENDMSWTLVHDPDTSPGCPD